MKRIGLTAFAGGVVCLGLTAVALGQCPTSWPGFEQSGANELVNTSIASGRNHVIAVSDDQLAIYDKCGQLQQSPMSLDGPGGFWEAQGAIVAGSLVFPRAVYDWSTQRFFVIAHTYLPEPSHWYIAWTQTDDPTGTWHKQQIASPYGVWLQYNSHVAIGPNDIWLSAQVSDSGAIWTLGRVDKAFLLANPTQPVPMYWTLPTVAGNYEAPAQRVTTETSVPQYAVNIQRTDVDIPCDQVHLYAYTFTAGTGVVNKLGPAVITVPEYSNGTMPVQPVPGQPLDIDFVHNPRRFQSAAYAQGKLWTAHSVGVSNAAAGVNRMVIRWYAFNMNGWNGTVTGPQPFLEQTGVIDGGSGTWAFSPSLAVTRAGGVGITYNQCGSQQYLSIRQRSRCANDPANTMPSTSVLYQSSEAYAPNYPSQQPVRWTNFTTTSSDAAVSNRFWSHAFGPTVAVPGGSGPWTTKWLTRIVRYESGCARDVNGDGVVDGLDAIAFMQAASSGQPEADLALDQAIDADDALEFQTSNSPK